MVENKSKNILKIKDYLISWWVYNGRLDDYVDVDQLVSATSEENAIDIVKSQSSFKVKAGKNFKAREVKIINYKTKEFEFID